jgi:hypothetical protein
LSMPLFAHREPHGRAKGPDCGAADVYAIRSHALRGEAIALGCQVLLIAGAPAVPDE